MPRYRPANTARQFPFTQPRLAAVPDDAQGSETTSNTATSPLTALRQKYLDITDFVLGSGGQMPACFRWFASETGAVTWQALLLELPFGLFDQHLTSVFA